MEVKTYTDFWTMEKKLYSVYDLSLPAPVSLKAVGIAIGIGVPWCFLLAFLHVPFTPPWFLAYLILPLGLAFAGTKQIWEKKNIFQLISSLVIFFFESRRYDGLRPVQDESETVYEYEVITWRKKE